MQYIEYIINYLNEILWGYILIFLLCGTGIYFTITLNLIQIRHFKQGLTSLFSSALREKGQANKQGMSSFQAVMTAISGQIGTGNLAGPATALLLGGPGAIFWMWISSFFGMATIYAEAILAQKFKCHDKQGQVVGGPAYYIEKGLGNKFLACCFAVLCIIALGIIGNMVQANAIAHAFNHSLNIPHWITGITVALITSGVIILGIRGVAKFTEYVVPFMAICYLIGAITILMFNMEYILPAFKSIFVAAFNPESVLGGGAGIAVQQAMRFGIARGLFANEAGMGSTPHAHAVARVKKPEQQGYTAMMGVFIVALIVTLTALVILTSGMKIWAVDSGNARHFLHVFSGTGISVTQQAYHVVFGHFGSVFIAISLFFFAFSTIIGWYYYAETNIRYLFNRLSAVYLFRLLVVICLFSASLFSVQFVWNIADLCNGLMVLPNLAALLILSPLIIRYTKTLRLAKQSQPQHEAS